MGIDCGFDIFPRLDATNEAHTRAYRKFLERVLDTYETASHDKAKDGKVLQLPARDSDGDFSTNSCVSFTVGEWPKIPANPKRCHCFLRFSSKVSGRQGHAEPYIRGVYEIAKEYFGVRVRWWDHLYDRGVDSREFWGYYDWAEVHEADEELKQLETEEQEVNREGTEQGNVKVVQGQ